MSNYTKTTDFGAKDSLPTGDSGKIIRGTEFETEFDAISTAIATKADIAGPTFTGTLTYETISDGTISITAFVDEDDMSSNSANLVPTQQSVKAYVDAVTTELQAQDLDFQADSGGALSIDLDTETMTFTGGTGITTAGSGNDVEFAIDSTVATLTGTQTLTNKTLTSPDVNTPDIDGGTIDGTVIGGTTPAAVSATTVSATGNITVGGTVDGRDVATDGTKLDGIESGATADQTAAEIRTLVESATDSNVFTDADHTKLDGIEAGATGDQTNAEIRAAVEAATDSNVFTDADHSKLDGIEAGADVTDTTNVTAAGAVMDSELTNETAVKSLNQGVATTDSPTFAGLTTTADVSFGDNDKAIFGAGSDLQIYHTSADDSSYIREIGAGNLKILGDNVQIMNSAGTENQIFSASDAGVYLYHNGNARLETTSTGIDVTGSISTDGLVVDGDINMSDSTPVFTMTDTDGGSANMAVFSGSLVISADSANEYTSRVLQLGVGDKSYLNIDDNGDISFREDTGSTAKLFWDAADERLGLGTTSPTAVLTSVNSGALTLDSNDGNHTGFGLLIEPSTITANTVNSAIGFARSGGRKYAAIGMQTYADTDQNGLNFYVQSTASGSSAELTEAMRIDESGQVGIGTSVPSDLMTIQSPASGGGNGITIKRNDNGTDQRVGAISFGNTVDSDLAQITVQTSSGNNGDGNLLFHTQPNGGSSTERMRIDASGNVGIGTDSPSAKLTLNDAGQQVGIDFKEAGTTRAHIEYDGTIPALELGTNGAANVVLKTSNTERMRIDSSGNLLVGKTSADVTTQGIVLRGGTGESYFSRTNDNPVYINRNTSDGGLISFRKDGSEVGSIGTESGYLAVGSPHGQSGYLGFRSNMVYPSTSTGGNRDDSIDLGGSSQRFDDIYATNGTIVTSDRNEKQDIETLSEAEQRVAVACKGLLRKFRWKSSVTENGNDARIHFGIIAQDLQAAFTAEGLDAGRYAMFINSTWTDEETSEERSRMGVRYSELLAFIIAAI